MKKYIDGPLGHYVINVTSAAKLCSKALCKKNGRCVRKRLDSGAYLHLNPRFFHIRRRDPAPPASTSEATWTATTPWT